MIALYLDLRSDRLGHRLLKKLLADYEKRIIMETSESCKSIPKAAEILSMSHTALRKKLKTFNIKMETFKIDDMLYGI